MDFSPLLFVDFHTMEYITSFAAISISDVIDGKKSSNGDLMQTFLLLLLVCYLWLSQRMDETDEGSL